MSGAVILFSGGQDSTTCLLQAIETYGVENTACISFVYGQRHSAEIEAAKAIVKQLGVPRHQIIRTDWFAELTHNSLLDHSMPLKAGENNQPANSFVAGRNAFFLLAAAVYARELGWQDIITGVCETDYSGYPDCRAAFIKSMNETVNLALDGDFRIITPLMYLTKAETWALADSLGKLDFVKKNTLTCYEGVIGSGCGKCPACLLRAKGLKEHEQTCI